MEKVKFRVWDNETKTFFQNKSTREGTTSEILMSQEGELYLHEITKEHFNEPLQAKLTHEKDLASPGRFQRTLYSGLRDSNQSKYFFNDIACFIDQNGNRSYGVVIWDGDKLAIGSQPYKDGNDVLSYAAIDTVTEKELRATEKAGNIYQNSNLLFGEI